MGQRKGKELLASETVWGAVDDAKHVEVLRYTLGELRKRGIGFTVHALQHSLVSDLHFAPVTRRSASFARTLPYETLLEFAAARIALLRNRYSSSESSS